MVTSDKQWLVGAIEKIAAGGAAAGEAKLCPIPETSNGERIPNAIPYALVPPGYKVESLLNFVHNDFAERPHRIKASVSMFTAASFVVYLRKFATTERPASCFAAHSSSTVKAVLDYHESPTAPGWGQHTATLRLKHTPEYEAWSGANNEKVSQDAFASFIEENSADIVDPSAASLMEQVSNFHSTTEVKFSSVKNLGNGRIQVSYQEAEKDNYNPKNTELPQKIRIRLAIFEGMQPQEFDAYIRYQVKGTELKIGFTIVGLGRAVRAAFRAVLTSLGESLEGVATIYEGFE